MTLPSRVAGVVVPLCSIPSTESWGIGEFADIPPLAGWLRRAGLGILQLLPLNETSLDVFSPYSPLTAMALDPQFITLREVEDFVASGAEASLEEEARRDLARARQARPIDYRRVRAAKQRALRRAFDRFVDAEWKTESPRARRLRRYVEEQSWWIEAYALFRALRAAADNRPWRSWPAKLQRADRGALATARADLDREVLFYQYLQWIAEGQWQAARRAVRPVGIFGDFPFLVDADSADVWTRQDEFVVEATVGAPPDDFNDRGQDWGLPPCNWGVMAARGDEWIQQRDRRMAALFDGYRVDHLVGFYRTYVRPHAGAAYFSPAAEADQLAQGERLMRIFRKSRARVTVEDLGNVPRFVRASLARLGLAGYRVLRWEREWDQPGQPFRDPATYPPVSVATTGTHDTETLADWWESLTPDDRTSIAELHTVARMAGTPRPLDSSTPWPFDKLRTDGEPGEPGPARDRPEDSRRSTSSGPMASPANQGQLRVDGSIVERQHAPGERGPTKQGAHDLTSPTFDEPTRNALVETMYAAGSDLLILPIQDVFGWRDRINVPGHVSDRNWTFKLPWPVDRLESEPAAVACAERLRTWAERHGRI